MKTQQDLNDAILKTMDMMTDKIVDMTERIAELEKRFGIELMEDRGDDSGLTEGGDKNNEEPEPKD